LWKSKEDYVVREVGRAKMIWLTEKRWEAAERIDLMGRIAAEAQGRGGGRGLFFGDRASSGRSERRGYCLRMVGQSMVGARIEDGGLLVVEEDEAPPDGAVIVALLRGGAEVTVKLALTGKKGGR
jgi:repressor LexA